MKRIEISDHARKELERRQLTEELVVEIVRAPEQVIPSPPFRMIYQSRFKIESGKKYLARVVVEEMIDKLIVVTTYRTSKIYKYWSVK